ncbi:MAG: FHA domain-containing protein, partial [Thermodesulfobacteriota bacterium]
GGARGLGAGRTVAETAGGRAGGPAPAGVGAPGARPDPMGHTISMAKKTLGIEPVVGWLVCTDGKQKGRDYRLRAGSNLIGRSPAPNQIVIDGDEAISREGHAEIVYDFVDNIFYLIRGKNPAVRLNGKMVLEPMELKSHDVVQLGETVFLFIPLCTENFKWGT